MHQRTSGLSSTDTSQENDVKAEPLRTSRKYSSESHKSIPTHYKDDEYYNKYLVNLVNDRFDKSKGKYKNTQSEKTAKNESAIWRDPEKLKQALVEKYAKGQMQEIMSQQRETAWKILKNVILKIMQRKVNQQSLMTEHQKQRKWRNQKSLLERIKIYIQYLP
jgi:hypothetical protein